eukprot:CFRG1680T1
MTPLQQDTNAEESSTLRSTVPTPVAAPTNTVWGARASNPVDGWVAKLDNNDSSFKSLYVMSFRKLNSHDFNRLCAAICNSKYLEEFHIGQALTEEDLDALCECLAVNNSLRILSVGNKTFGLQGLERISSGLLKNTSICTLDLENKGLGDDGAECLASIITDSTNLKIENLKLGRNDIGDTGLIAICNALKHNETLKTLDLHVNSFGSTKAMSSLGTYLARAECTLEGLNLSTNPNVKEISVVEFSENGLACNRSLRSLILSECCVGDEGVDSLTTALTEQKGITSLLLDGCGITAIGASSLQRLLEADGKLEELIVRNNAIGESGFTTIGAALKTNRTLRVLECGGCGIPSVPSLGCETTITHLGLFNNSLGDSGILSILDALVSEGNVSLKSLLSLDVSGNEVTDEGFKTFCSRLGDNLDLLPALTTLEIGGNKADDKEAWVSVCEAFAIQRPGVKIIWGDGHKY